MVNFSNTMNYLATQINNETSFKQHNKKRFIIVAGVKEWEWESVPLGVAGQYVGPWFLESVCEACSSVFFSDGVKSGISSSGCEGCLFGLLTNCSLRLSSLPKGARKNSSRGRRNQCAQPIDWSFIAELLSGGIGSWKEIDLWLLQIYTFANKINLDKNLVSSNQYCSQNAFQNRFNQNTLMKSFKRTMCCMKSISFNHLFVIMELS